MSENGLHPDDERFDSLAASDGSPLDDDASEADVVEQRRDVVDRERVVGTLSSDEVDPADAYEQTQVVEYDEDDYR
ncbi:MAG TPA: hypothetical protein VFQ15_04795 [Jiangellaceae bacterium]|nr:hypothetical protein [Jiangellaceae bacterium]